MEIDFNKPAQAPLTRSNFSMCNLGLHFISDELILVRAHSGKVYMSVNSSSWYKAQQTEKYYKIKKAFVKGNFQQFADYLPNNFCPNFGKIRLRKQANRFYSSFKFFANRALWKILLYVEHLHIFALQLDRIQ